MSIAENLIKLTNQTMEEKIKLAIAALKKRGLLIFPSDTVYGALVDAQNEAAVNKLIEFKLRPLGKPISVFVSDFKMLEKLVEINKKQSRILHEILPGPFTVILKSKHKVSRLLESEKGTLGIRLPQNYYVEKLMAEFKKPLTATSANLSGYPPHYSIESLMNRLPEKKKKLIDYVFDVGQLFRNKPSTVVDLTTPSLKIIRQGELGFRKVGSYISKSPDQTAKIGEFILNKFLKKGIKKPIIFIITGDLGVGKTILVKGMGNSLGVDDIISPSYVIYYEYPVTKINGVKTLIHADFYNIEEASEFDYLGLDQFLIPEKIICIEWGEKTGDIISKLKTKGELIYIEMKYTGINEREIKISKQ